MSDHNRPASSEYFQGKLYQQMHDDLHLAGKAPRTVNGYLRSVRQLADYCQCSPDQVSEQQLRNWLLYLKNEKEFAYGSLRVAFSGIKFFFTRTCKRDWETLKVTKLRNVKSLPEVLTRQQVHLIIDACTTQRMATYFWTVYSLGLRVEEGLNLHIGDVDGKRMMVHVHRGKGAKDRYIPTENVGFFGALHTWGRDPATYHPHVHFVVPGGGVSRDGKRWLQTPKDFLFHHGRAIRLYKKRFAKEMKKCGLYKSMPYGVLKKKWVVDLKPVGNGQAVLKYLAPYVYRVAITDNRIEAIDEHGVSYQVTPSGTKQPISQKVSGHEFVRSFVQHILPPGFQKIRYYGFMSPNCKLRLEVVRWLVWLYLGWTYWLGSAFPTPQPTPKPRPTCKDCGGNLTLIAITRPDGRVILGNPAAVHVRGPP